jgi:hypothetical protein
LALGHAHSRRRALDPHILYINRCRLAQGRAFWGFNTEKLHFGELFHQNSLIFRPE